MNSILGLWDGLVESVALIAILVTALALMVRVIELGRGLKINGSALGALVLLVMLPAILVGIWHSISGGQRVGIGALTVLLIAVMQRGRRTIQRERRKH